MVLKGVGMVIYNVQTNGASNQLVIELINDTISIDAESVAYVTGNINLDADEESFSKKLKAYFVGKKVNKPKFHGTGKIYLYATLGSYHKFSLKNGEELYLNPSVFVVCRDSVELIPQVSLSVKNFLSGVPLVNLKAKGHGSLMVLMPGPLQECILNDEKFVALGKQIAAYSTTLTRTREIFGKTWFSDPKMAHVFRGKGSLFFCPIPNKDSKSKIVEE